MFIELFKNTPLITQIFIVYFGVSSVHIVLSVFVAGALSLMIPTVPTSRRSCAPR